MQLDGAARAPDLEHGVGVAALVVVDDVIEAVVIFKVDLVDLLDPLFHGLGLVQQVVQRILRAPQRSQRVDVLHQVGHVHEEVVPGQLAAFRGQRQVLQQPFVFRVEGQLRRAVPAVLVVGAGDEQPRYEASEPGPKSMFRFGKLSPRKAWVSQNWRYRATMRSGSWYLSTMSFHFNSSGRA